jgi:D-alanyl-D-alanine carboxypeptidase (penicillin-binding protein 5/6)
VVLAIALFISVPLWLLTPLGANVLNIGQADPPLPLLAVTPRARPTPQPALIPTGAPAALAASEAILVDADSGAILYEKNAETPVPMASTTKIMTALIALRSGKLDQVITIGQDAIDQDGIGSSAGLYAGERVPLKELLYGLLLPSGDDAAVAIADGLAGSQDAFVTIMNTEAQRLHLFQTRFYNPSGLDTDQQLNPIPPGQHYTTPYDLVRLARYAMTIPLFAHIVSSRTYLPPANTSRGVPLPWKNTNTLLTSFPGTVGIKTGWTQAAGGCLVFAATRQGHTLIGVVLHSIGARNTQLLDELARATDSKTLLTWGFSLSTLAPRVYQRSRCEGRKGAGILIGPLRYPATQVRRNLAPGAAPIALDAPERQAGQMVLPGKGQNGARILQSKDLPPVIIGSDHGGHAEHTPELSWWFVRIKLVQLVNNAMGSTYGVLRHPVPGGISGIVVHGHHIDTGQGNAGPHSISQQVHLHGRQATEAGWQGIGDHELAALPS